MSRIGKMHLFVVKTESKLFQRGLIVNGGERPSLPFLAMPASLRDKKLQEGQVHMLTFLLI